MRSSVKVFGAAAVAVAALGAGPAAAAEAEATLTCGSATYPISGFSRGQVFHVVGSNSEFVVTQAQIVLSDGPRTVFDNPGQAGRADILTCRTVSPRGTSYIFSGFFTPLA